MTISSDTLSMTFAALANPTRRDILARLAEDRELSVTELAEPFQMTMPAITKHLKVLEKAGLIERDRRAQLRPARLDADPLREVAEWVAQYRQHWEDRIDRLDAYLQDLKAKEEKHDQESS